MRYTMDAKGNLDFNGSLERTKGNHAHMPSRTAAYEPGDERGHINASSLGGINTRLNIAPQHRDVNHGSYYAMEQGERNALANGASIQSHKAAYVESAPGNRPSAFLVNDTITYRDGHTEKVNLSFTNVSNAEQERWSTSLGEINAPNPGDSLRETMSKEEYGALMEQTNANLSTIAEEYQPTHAADELERFDAAQQNAPEPELTTAREAISHESGITTELSCGL